MTLVNDHMYPLDLRQQRSLLDDILVRRETHLEIGGTQAVVLLFSLSWRAFQDDSSDGRGPSFKLESPVGKGGKGDNDEEGSRLAFPLDKIGDEGNRLDRFPETLRKVLAVIMTGRCAHHFVRQNPIQPVVVQTDHPLQPLNLVVLKGTAAQHVRLPCYPLLYSMRDSVVIHLARFLLCTFLFSILPPSTERCFARWSFLLFK